MNMSACESCTFSQSSSIDERTIENRRVDLSVSSLRRLKLTPYSNITMSSRGLSINAVASCQWSEQGMPVQSFIDIRYADRRASTCLQANVSTLSSWHASCCGGGPTPVATMMTGAVAAQHWGGDACWQLRKKYKTKGQCTGCARTSWITYSEPKATCQACFRKMYPDLVEKVWGTPAADVELCPACYPDAASPTVPVSEAQAQQVPAGQTQHAPAWQTMPAPRAPATPSDWLWLRRAAGPQSWWASLLRLCSLQGPSCPSGARRR